MRKQTVIILEGHDTAGKSHIAAELSKRLRIPIFKAKRDKHWWDPMVNLFYYTEGVTQFIEQTKVSVILDRWHPSDYMYSHIFDRDISYKKIFQLDKRFAAMNTLLIICYKDKNKYIDDTEDFEFVNKKMYTKMTDHYKDYASQSAIKNTLFLNTSSEDIEHQISEIMLRLE